MLHKQKGNAVWGTIKLLALLFLAYMLIQTNKHLDEKYALPPTSASVPAPAPTKVQ